MILIDNDCLTYKGKITALNHHNSAICSDIAVIEKKCFSDLFNKGFDYAKDLEQYCKEYKTSSKFEERVIHNYEIIELASLSIDVTGGVVYKIDVRYCD